MSTPPLLFLYQTRTILRCRRLPSITRSMHVSPSHRRKSDDHIPFAREIPEDVLPLEDTKETRGTITPTERQTFDRIFSDIAARGLKPRPQQDRNAQSSETTRRAANLILEAAASDDAGKGLRGKPISAAQMVSAAKDKEKALLRFPPSLRAAATRAFELLNPDHPSSYAPAAASTTADGDANSSDEIWETPKNSTMRLVEVDAKRYPEQKRVEDLMSTAKSDFELWDIMEREVFTYPQKLGLHNVTAPVKISGKARRKDRKKKRQAQEQATGLPHESKEDVFEGDPKLNLYVYGPLYPSFLLFGLRLLDKGFVTPSPLALSVLPRIKELGLESFVLGVSTPFYNELLGIYYGRHGDLTNMMTLLEEMSHSGLYLDEGTVSVLIKAYNQTEQLATGAHGQFAHAFMTMPAYEKSVRNSIRHWHRDVDLSIKQRDADIDYRQMYRG
ncbi:hypothetical protein PFICI_03937 [Pestalotiopsis fici W106-1]|uniref:Mtf2-like C-terminal domain-containing protein n=1 Tax=Pestalotiopsis fici (strain W106-1 / CGMCC3.15140) TaxID=1229662 RepID=W3XKC1_PESFW|nr:uncharacterized protein PFICI_03937 [Pestalotiopsis fici W106-1]ETS85912.1 hypothetical protein PFICI_03937 [Pestalotiopsis fici W106-1]